MNIKYIGVKIAVNKMFLLADHYPGSYWACYATTIRCLKNNLDTYGFLDYLETELYYALIKSASQKDLEALYD